MDITSFSGEHRFLSNFWPCTVTLDGEQYPSVENAYQAAKIDASDAAGKIARVFFQFLAPGTAKKRGAKCQLRPDWEQVKLGIMRDLLMQKFGSDPTLFKLLIATHPFHLVEGNNWGDTYWGVCRGRGLNHLGRLLMEVRQFYIDHSSIPQ